jgi:phage baseplate assembly protein V
MRREPRQDAQSQYGVVTSVNEETYRVKVQLTLLGIETDYIRVGSQYVGAGWGLRALPHVGNEVVVEFPNGDWNNGIVTWRLYSEECDPTPQEGDSLTLVHESGSILRFDKAGNVTLEAKGNLTLRGANVYINE